MKFANLHILVLGDVMLDKYQFGECTRISPEAPVPVVQIDNTKTKSVPGGAANVAANVIALGAACSLGAKMGLDNAGGELNDLLVKRGVFPIFAYPQGYRTPVKTRIIAQNQQIVRIDDEKNVRFEFDIAKVLAHIPYCDALILSDYDKGYFAANNVKLIIEKARALKKIVVVDTKPKHLHWFEGAHFFTPNQAEFDAMVPRIFDMQAKILITMGPDGMQYRDGGSSANVKAIRREVVDVSGAGDTAVAAFTLAIASGMTGFEAMDFANKAAGVVVGKQGTSTVTLEEIAALEEGLSGVRTTGVA